MEFESFGKIARLSRMCTITEKIDGTNACVSFENVPTDIWQGTRLFDRSVVWSQTNSEDGSGVEMRVGSRTRWITPDDDNAGFAKWAMANKEELLQLGYGRHYGEWWGKGLQRSYGQTEKKFSLFNTNKWGNSRPSCCGVVPVLYEGMFHSNAAEHAIESLHILGSFAAPGFTKPEGIMIYHHAANMYFKKTLEKDESPKGLVE